MHTMNSYRDYVLSQQNTNWYNHPSYSNISVPQWNYPRPYDSTAHTHGYTDQHNLQNMYTVSQNVKYNEHFPTKGYQQSFIEPNQKFHPSNDSQNVKYNKPFPTKGYQQSFIEPNQKFHLFNNAQNTGLADTPFSTLGSAQTSQFLKEKALGGNADSGSPFVFRLHESNNTTRSTCVTNTALNLTKKTPMKPSVVVPACGLTRTKQNKKTPTKNKKSNKKPPNFLDIPSATSKTKRQKTKCKQDLIVPPVNPLAYYERNHFYDKPVDLSVNISNLHSKSAPDSVFPTCGTDLNINSRSVDKNTELFKSTSQGMKLPIVLPQAASQETRQNLVYDTPSPSWHSNGSSPESTHNPSDHENATSAERDTTCKLNIYWTSNTNSGGLAFTPCQKVQDSLNEPFGSQFSLLDRNSLTPTESNELTPVFDVHNAYTKPYNSHPNETITIDLDENFQTSVHVKQSLPPSCNSTKDITEIVPFHPRLSSTPTSDSHRPNQSTPTSDSHRRNQSTLSTSRKMTAKKWDVPENCVTSYCNRGSITSHKEAKNILENNGSHFNAISSSVNNSVFKSTKVDDCFTTEFEMRLKNRYEHWFKPSTTAVNTPTTASHATAQSAAALHTTFQIDLNTTRPVTAQTDSIIERKTVTERPSPECSNDSLSSNLMPQKRKRQRETRYSCHLCSYKVRKLFNFRLHVAQHCSDTEKLVQVKAQNLKLRCGICAYFATSAKALRRHVEKHALEKRFLCGYCRQDFRSDTEVLEHVTEIHKREVVFYDRKKLYEDMTRKPQLEINLKPCVVLDSKEVEEYFNPSR